MAGFEIQEDKVRLQSWPVGFRHRGEDMDCAEGHACVRISSHHFPLKDGTVHCPVRPDRKVLERFDLMSQVFSLYRFNIHATTSLKCFKWPWCPQRQEGGRKRWRKMIKAFFLFGTAGWRGDLRSGPVAPPWQSNQQPPHTPVWRPPGTRNLLHQWVHRPESHSHSTFQRRNFTEDLRIIKLMRSCRETLMSPVELGCRGFAGHLGGRRRRPRRLPGG